MRLRNNKLAVGNEKHKASFRFSQITTGRALRWRQIWGQNYRTYVIGKQQDILFWLYHNCLPTRTRLHRQECKRDGRSSPNCKYCRNTPETTLHVFSACHIATKVWQRYKTIIEGLTKTPFDTVTTIFSLTAIQPKLPPLTIKLLYTLVNYIVTELWQSRNRLEKEGAVPNIELSVKFINYHLRELIHTHYKYALRHNTVQQFKDKFVINAALCYFRRNTLLYHLP